MRRELVLGIDLGTTQSSAAVQIGDEVHLITDGRGEPCFPSVVYFPKSGPPEIGAAADVQRCLDPANTIVGVKRLLGRGTDPHTRRLFEASSAVKLKPYADQLCMMTRGGTYTPTEVVSLIFSHLKARAQLKFGARVKWTLLTVPVNATPQIIAATSLAAKLAGLEVLDVIPEPIAASAVLDLDLYKGERRFLTYDFGGGTFDVAVIDQRDQLMRPLATDGDDFLGGDDFDDALAKKIASLIWTARKIDITHDVVTWDGVRRRAEAAKRALSRQNSTRVRVGDADTNDVEFEVTLDEVRPLWADLVKRSVEKTAAAVLAAGLRPNDLQGIMMVGGTSWVRQVRERVAAVFQRPILNVPEPTTAVASGAAIWGRRVFESKAGEQTVDLSMR